MAASSPEWLVARESSPTGRPFPTLPAPGPDSWRSILSLVEEQRLEEAGAQIEQYLALYPTHVQLWIQRGNLLWKQNRMAEAELAYRRALQLAPESAPACWCLVLLYRHMGREEEAMLWYQRAIASGAVNTASAGLALGVALPW